jgi:hypothetical protein
MRGYDAYTIENGIITFFSPGGKSDIQLLGGPRKKREEDP